MKGRGRGSRQHAVSIAVIAALAAAALTGAAAQESAAAAHASAAHGKAISYTCLGCHGIDDYKNAYPMYSVPKLEGQNPEYLAAALHGYRDGDRSHLTMHSQASTLSDKDMEDIAAYFAGKPLAPTGKAQGSVPQTATLCVSCHGHDGLRRDPQGRGHPRHRPVLQPPQALAQHRVASLHLAHGALSGSPSSGSRVPR